MRFRLKSLMPRSLFGRAALILVVPVVAVQLIVSVTFIQRHFEGVTRQMTQGVLIELDYLLAAVNGAPTLADAQSAAARLGQALQLQMVVPLQQANVPAQDRRSFLDYAGLQVIVTLRQGLEGIAAVDLTANSREVQVYLNTGHGLARITILRSRVSASNPHQLLVWMVFTSALMTFIAYVFLRNQLTPITRLAIAAEAFGKGQTVPYRPRGATEVRAAGNAFLDMRARIERQIESRTLLLSGVSHDLRTPLTRLKLGLSFLPDDDETAALQRDVVDMERLVDEFLAFVRGDAMEEPEVVDPAHLIARAVENAVRGGHVVRLGPVEAAGPLRLRPQAVMRALENLIGNAVRFGKQVEVSLSVSDRMLRLVVEDDGPGIPRALRDEAVVPFKRLDAARDPNRGGGVGLGLSIAADIARSHGGALWLGESERLGGLRAELRLLR
jgi:two-component system, OmpR family, osmolarity sensor histidine kinase EnvZ